MKCKQGLKSSSFKINYSKEVVKFKDKIFDKKKMGLKEFAITVLQIEPVSIEIIAILSKLVLSIGFIICFIFIFKTQIKYNNGLF